MSGKKLVIVESPAKSRSIGKYLGDDFIVDASAGHIRDLPQPSELPENMKKGPFSRFAVNPEKGFEPYYVISDSKKSKVRELKKRLKEADELYLATDADREGEAIAWHLYEVLKPKVPTFRLTFTEITKEGIQRAMENPREIDIDLVDAQETRRILDRLYGYEISPVLWRKVGKGLSAGRVQSVATRMVVDRERERMAFIPASYWDLSGEFSTETKESFTAKLTAVDGARIAAGGDFTDAGELKKSRRDVVILGQKDAESLADGLTQAPFSVDSVEDKPYSRRPQPPFITSTLQQDAARRLRFSSRVTMQVAQRLYENGYITYMRTDSTTLSSEALNAARKQATELYGAESVPAKPRFYGKRNQTAQEAHEAIRPAGDSFRTPRQVKAELSADEFKLYELIWKRTVASQMEDAKGYTASVRLTGTASDGRTATFGASGTVITFPGFLAAYEEVADETESSSKKSAAKDKRLPQLAEGQGLTGEQIEAKGHETSPPPRFTEASIVAELEKREIGRPSTYAPTISTIMDRGYVTKRGTALVPSWTAFSVIRLLEEHFGQYVDYSFTARLEDDLDQISRGEIEREAWLQGFYFGASSGEEGLKAVVDNLGEIDARAINSIEIAPGVNLRVGRYGPYLERVNQDGEVDENGELKLERANLPQELAPDELTADKAEELFEQAAYSGRVLGHDPETGRELVAKDGRYGPYVTEVIPEMTEEEIQAHMEAQPTEYYKNGKPKPKKKPKKEKPRTGSLMKNMTLESVTLDDALKILSLPRVLGLDDGEEITAQNGRFGPYLKKGSDSRSLENEEQLFTITLDEAKKIYAQPKQRGRRAAQPPLAEFGADPTSEKPVVVKDGRFGPYVTDGETNVTVPRSTSVEMLTKEHAFSLLAEKRAKGPATKAKRTRSKAKS